MKILVRTVPAAAKPNAGIANSWTYFPEADSSCNALQADVNIASAGACRWLLESEAAKKEYQTALRLKFFAFVRGPVGSGMRYKSCYR
jgi:hypothetical protein